MTNQKLPPGGNNSTENNQRINANGILQAGGTTGMNISMNNDA